MRGARGQTVSVCLASLKFAIERVELPMHRTTVLGMLLVACVEKPEKLDYRDCTSDTDCQDFAECVESVVDCSPNGPSCQRPCATDGDCPEHPSVCESDGYCFLPLCDKG